MVHNLYTSAYKKNQWKLKRTKLVLLMRTYVLNLNRSQLVGLNKRYNFLTILNSEINLKNKNINKLFSFCCLKSYLCIFLYLRIALK